MIFPQAHVLKHKLQREKNRALLGGRVCINQARKIKYKIQGVFEMRAQILITSYWLHGELGKNPMSKSKMTFIF
jgi:hypothetical protein